MLVELEAPLSHSPDEGHIGISSDFLMGCHPRTTSWRIDGLNLPSGRRNRSYKNCPEFQTRSQGLPSPHPKRSEKGKALVQAGHVSWWQIYLHWRGHNLSEYCLRCRLLPTKPASWAAMESSLLISQRRFVISIISYLYYTLLYLFETKLGLETVKREEF